MRIGNLYSIKTEINSDNISFFLLFLNLAYWHSYICQYKIMKRYITFKLNVLCQKYLE